jgi:PAS domain S-box-containing protein
MEDLDRMVCQRTEELRASEERFSKAFHSSPSASAILDSAHRGFLDANQAFLDLSGYLAHELTAKSDKELRLWTKAVDGDPAAFLPEGRNRNSTCQLRRKDGALRQVILSSEPVALGTAPCLLVIAQDITDQMKLESQLRQAQKMEVIGRMAAGIAHEFNNVLTVIQGDVGLLQSPVAASLDKNALLNQIMQASQRAATFTKQLLAFSRKQVLQPRLLDLSSVVQNTRKMLSRLLGEKYEVQLNCPSALTTVLADEGGVEQILINLALNARDAMPQGGVIHIATGLQILSEATAALTAEARPGRFVTMTITDSGCGMDSQVLARIFDPFFTTKDIGKGTGLGLSTIHGIVKQHEGWIQVSSELGKGSQFTVYFPACDAPATPVRPAEPAAVPEPGKGETILVVEDEAAVRELATAALERQGYCVMKAANGPEAIGIWERGQKDVTLLLTDMIMPSGMSGGELAGLLQSRNPQLKVLYTSGYSPEIFRKDSALINGMNFLPKPYDLTSLLKAVRKCLDNEMPARNKRAVSADPVGAR